jgi:uncharacterized membrane protein
MSNREILGQEMNLEWPSGSSERDRMRRWAIVGGGTLLALGLFRRTPRLLAAAAGGGYMAYRALTGGNPIGQVMNMVRRTGQRSVSIDRSITINVPPSEVYNFWRDVENLDFMQHVESVHRMGETRSRWVATPLLGIPLEWDAEITDDRKNEHITWRSVRHSQIETWGSVHFAEAPGGRGTEVRVNFNYSPPGGVAGATVAKLINWVTAEQVDEDLRHLKQLLETGEVSIVEGQTSGRSDIAERFREVTQQ